tara:strand:+ start:5502 stop:5705 length:204 start_codon:yes stop_codon:yes gene_type:complete
MFKQCTLQKGITSQTSWIPEKFAVKGNYLRLKDDDGWKVLDVGASMTDEQIKAQQQRVHEGIFASIK